MLIALKAINFQEEDSFLFKGNNEKRKITLFGSSGFLFNFFLQVGFLKKFD